MKSKNLIKTGIIACCIMLGANTVFAAGAPDKFRTRNFTPYESNAKVKGIMSPYPTSPGSAESPSERGISWGALRIVCGLFSSTCDAEIYMKTDTPNPVFVAKGTMDLKSGDITPKEAINNGFKLTSPEPGLIEIREVN